MKRQLLLLSLLMMLPLWAVADRLPEKGADAGQLVPEGWHCTEKLGDLNKDGIDDLVIIALPNDEAGLLKVEGDDYVYNLNQPILAIYFGQAGGGFLRWKEYGNVLLPNPDEFLIYNYSSVITERGTLIISAGQEASAGSWSNTSCEFTYRFQNGDFYLIGKEEESAARNTGEGQRLSYNYLTHKCQRTTFNLFDDEKPVEHWSRIPAKPLKKLGEHTIPE